MYSQALGWENMAFVFLNRYLDLVEVRTSNLKKKMYSFKILTHARSFNCVRLLRRVRWKCWTTLTSKTPTSQWRSLCPKNHTSRYDLKIQFHVNLSYTLSLSSGFEARRGEGVGAGDLHGSEGRTNPQQGRTRHVRGFPRCRNHRNSIPALRHFW